MHVGVNGNVNVSEYVKCVGLLGVIVRLSFVISIQMCFSFCPPFSMVVFCYFLLLYPEKCILWMYYVFSSLHCVHRFLQCGGFFFLYRCAWIFFFLVIFWKVHFCDCNVYIFPFLSFILVMSHKKRSLLRWKIDSNHTVYQKFKALGSFGTIFYFTLTKKRSKAPTVAISAQKDRP